MKHLIDQPVRVRTTVDLPRELLDRSQDAVDRKLAKNKNTLFTAALSDYLDQLDQRAIDSEFASMAHDAAYQELNLQIFNEFTQNDRQAQVAGDDSP